MKLEVAAEFSGAELCIAILRPSLIARKFSLAPLKAAEMDL
jgi:hypothetical protein